MPQHIEVPGMGVVEFPDGMNDDQIAAAIKSNMPSTTEDVAKSAGIGLAKGAIGLAGGIGDAAHLFGDIRDRYIVNPINRALGLQEVDLNAPDPATKIGSASIQKMVESQTGDFYRPKTTAGKYAETAGEFVPGALLTGGGGPVLNSVRYGVLPGLASEAAGQYTEGTKLEPYARVAAAIAASAAGARAGRVVTPIPSSPERQRLVDILHDEGVTSLTAGQRTGNKALQYAESILGDAPGAGQGASAIQQEGQRQFTAAAVRRAGTGAADATPETLAANNQRLGDQFRDLSARNTLVPDNQFITDVTAAVRDYRNVPNSQQRAIVQGYIDDIIDHVNAGHMPGPQYQEMRSRLSRQANNLRNADPTLSDALRDMRNALDNAMERSIPAGSGDAELWRQSRREYAAQKTIEQAASRAGEATTEGQILPSNLRNAVSAQNRGAYARGEGDFSELARAGSGVMAPLPNSGTGQRAGIQAIISALGGGAGAGLAGAPGAMLGAVAAGTAPAIVGRAMMSRPVQAYLGNQLIPANADPRILEIARLIAAGRAGATPLLEALR